MRFDSVLNDNVAIYYKTEAFKYSDYAKLASQNKTEMDAIKGKSVCLFKLSSYELAKLLPLLEGHVSSLLIIPDSLDTSTSEKLECQVSVEYRISLNDNNQLLLSFVGTNQSEEYAVKSEKTVWIIPTSGTTNVPKLVCHSFDSLTRTVKKNTRIGKELRWGLTYQISRFAGLQVFLQSILGGSSLIIPDEALSLTQKLDVFAKHLCTCLSATPSYWRMVLMQSVKSELSTLTHITLGGEIATQDVLSGLQQTFPNARIAHIYASTEAGVGFSVLDCQEGFPVSYLHNADLGAELIVSTNGNLLIKSTRQCDSYIGSRSAANDDGFIDTGDQVKIKGDRVLFLGRDSGAINVGGNKVIPEEVENIILEHDAIQLCRVFGRKNPIMGSLVCCEYTSQSKLSDIEVKNELVAHCRGHLDDYKVPVLFKRVESIELNPNGKVVRG